MKIDDIRWYNDGYKIKFAYTEKIGGNIGCYDLQTNALLNSSINTRPLCTYKKSEKLGFITCPIYEISDETAFSIFNKKKVLDVLSKYGYIRLINPTLSEILFVTERQEIDPNDLIKIQDLLDNKSFNL